MKLPANLDLLLVTVGCLLAVAMAVLAMPVAVRIPVGIVAALVMPGYSLSMALFPPGELDGVERLALAISLSLGLIVLVAPILSLSPGGLSADAIIGAVIAVTLVATVVAWWRRRGRPADGHPSEIARPDRPRWPATSRSWVGAGLGLVAVLCIALLATDASRSPRTATEFFVLGPAGTAEGLPSRVAPGKPTSITVGITNGDASPQPYQIVVESGSARLASTGPISVEAGKTWIGNVDFTVPSPGNDQEIRILLYRDPAAQPYRLLRLVVDAFTPA